MRAGRVREELYVPAQRAAARRCRRCASAARTCRSCSRYFADQFATRDNLPYRRFSTAAQNRLRLHGWPGNLRELRNLVQRLLILGGAGDIELAEVEQALGALARTAAPRARRRLRDRLFACRCATRATSSSAPTSRYLLKQAEGSVGKLAVMAGMERTHLYRKLRDLGIDIKGERGS